MRKYFIILALSVFILNNLFYPLGLIKIARADFFSDDRANSTYETDKLSLAVNTQYNILEPGQTYLGVIYLKGKNGFSGQIDLSVYELPETLVYLGEGEPPYYATAKAALMRGVTVNFDRSQIEIKDGQWTYTYFSINYPSNLTEGKYKLGLKASGSGVENLVQIGHSLVYSNNSSACRSSLAVYPDKITIHPGESADFSISLLSRKYSGEYYLVDNDMSAPVGHTMSGVPQNFDTFINTRESHYLDVANGETKTIDYQITADANTPIGTYVFQIMTNVSLEGENYNKAISNCNVANLDYNYGVAEDFVEIKVESTSAIPVPTSTATNISSTPSADQTTSPVVSSAPAANSSSTPTTSNTSSTIPTNRSKDLKKEAQKKEKELAKTEQTGEEVGSLEDTPGELTITPESGLIDSKIELKGKNYPKDRELRIFWNPFGRYIRNKANEEDRPPFRYVGLLDLGIIKTDSYGEFSTYRVLPNEDPIVQALSGKHTIRVAEDKVFHGDMGNNDYPFNEKNSKNFTITIPEDLSKKQSESTAQVWVGKQPNQLSDAEKIAVTNLAAGLSEPAYNQPFSEDRQSASQKITSYTIEGNLGADDKKCRLQIKPGDFAYQNPLKKLTQGIFKSLGWAKAEEQSPNSLESQALENCPKTVKLSDFWKSPIAQQYYFGTHSKEIDTAKLNQYTTKLAQANSNLTSLMNINNEFYYQGGIKKLMFDSLNLLDELKDMPKGTTIFLEKDQTVDLTDYRDFLLNYLSVVMQITNNLPFDEERVQNLNQLLENHSFYKLFLNLPKIDKETVQARVESKVISELLLNKAGLSVGLGQCGKNNINIEQIKSNCAISYPYAMRQALANTQFKSDIDYVNSQLAQILGQITGGYANKDISQGESDFIKYMFLILYLGELKKQVIADDYSQIEKEQLQKIEEIRTWVMPSNSFEEMIRLKETLKTRTKEITQPKALIAYNDLVNYTNIKYKFLLGKFDSQNSAGYTWEQANAALASQVTDSDYLQFENPKIEEETNWLSNIYWRMIFSEDKNELNETLKQLKDKIKKFSDQSKNKLDQLVKYSQIKIDYLNDRTNGYQANKKIDELQYYQFIKFPIKSEDILTSKNKIFAFIQKTFAQYPNLPSTEGDSLLHNIYNWINGAQKPSFNSNNGNFRTNYNKLNDRINYYYRELEIAKLSNNMSNVNFYAERVNYTAYLIAIMDIGRLGGSGSQIENRSYKAAAKYFAGRVSPNMFKRIDEKQFSQKWPETVSEQPRQNPPTNTSSTSKEVIYYPNSDKYLKLIAVKPELRENAKKEMNSFKSYGAITKHYESEFSYKDSELYKMVIDQIQRQGFKGGQIDTQLNDLLKKDRATLGLMIFSALYGYNNINDDVKNFKEGAYTETLLKSYTDKTYIAVGTVREGQNDQAFIFDPNKSMAEILRYFSPCQAKKKKDSSLLSPVKSAYAAVVKPPSSSPQTPDDCDNENAGELIDDNNKGDGSPFGNLPPFGIPPELSNEIITEWIESLYWRDMELLKDIYTGHIPINLLGKLGEWGPTAQMFIAYMSKDVHDAARKAADEGKCGYQNLPLPDGKSIGVVILCNSTPLPGQGLGYGSSMGGSGGLSKKSGSVLAVDTADNNNQKVNYTNFIHLYSNNPLGLMVIDPTGRTAGWNPLSQQEIRQIANIDFNGISAKEPEMLLRGLLEGDYKIRLIGLEDGPYKVNLAIAMGDQVWTKTYQGMIKKNEIVDGSFKVGFEKKPIENIWDKFPINKGRQFTSISLGILLILGAAYYYIHTHNRLKLGI